jgi:RNA polymerase sigma factor (sigma-70 family)
LCIQGGKQGELTVTNESIEVAVARYRGLCRTTASMYVNSVEEEFDDIVQVLMVKAWVAVERFDESKWVRDDERQEAQDRFVFSCVKNGMKDVLKRPRRRLVFIEDVSPGDRPAELQEDSDLVYASVEDEGIVLPSTLSEMERGIIHLLTTGLTQIEAGARHGLSRHQIDRVMGEIRTKMADWKPTSPAPDRDAPPAALAA